MTGKTDIIIINYNTPQLTFECIDSINATTDRNEVSITVVDNASGDNIIEELKDKYPDVRAIALNENNGYGSAANAGARGSESDTIIISNADVVFHENSINILVNTVNKDSETGIAGPQQVFPDGSWEQSYGDIPGFRLGMKEVFMISGIQRLIKRYSWKKLPIDRNPKEADYIDGAVMAFRKEVFDKLSGFDENFFFFSEEADLCFRLKKAGYLVLFQPKAVVTHYRGGAYKTFAEDKNLAEMFIESKIRFCKKHYGNFHTRLYIYLEYIQTLLKKIMRSFFIKTGFLKSAESKSKMLGFASLNKIWKKYLRENINK